VPASRTGPPSSEPAEVVLDERPVPVEPELEAEPVLLVWPGPASLDVSDDGVEPQATARHVAKDNVVSERVLMATAFGDPPASHSSASKA
jgi:hypothetical protein